MHAFSLAPELCCDRCGLDDQFVSHGFVYQKQHQSQPVRVGKRLCCSNRFGRSGCGKTVRLYLADAIPRLHYSAQVVSLFLVALLQGSSVISAYQQAIGSEREARQAWRWIGRLYRQLPLWRADFEKRSESLVKKGSARLQVLLCSVADLLSQYGGCFGFQALRQRAFC